MKKIYILIILAVLSVQFVDGQFLKNAKKLLNNKGKGLTEKDAADGIKEALVNGKNGLST